MTEKELLDELPVPLYTMERCLELGRRYNKARGAKDDRTQTELIVALKRELNISHHGNVQTSLNAIAMKLTEMRKTILICEEGIRKGTRVLQGGKVVGEVLGITKSYNVAVRYTDGSHATLNPIALRVLPPE